MKRYNVVCKIDNHEQFMGNTPHNRFWDDDIIPDSVAARSPEEAINLGIEYILERLTDLDIKYEADKESNEIKVFDDEEVTEFYHDFRAIEEGDAL